MIANSEYTETENEFRRSIAGKRVSRKELLANPDVFKKWNNCMRRTSILYGLSTGILSGISLYGIIRMMRIHKYAKYFGIFGFTTGYFIGKTNCMMFCLQRAVGVNVIRADAQDGDLHLTFDTALYPLREEEKTLESEQSKQSNLDYEDFRFSNMYSNDLHSINGVDEYSPIVNNETEPSNSQKSMTYNELRQKHREQYRIYGKNVESLPVQQKAPPPPPPSDTEPVKPVRRNKYGDIME